MSFKYRIADRLVDGLGMILSAAGEGPYRYVLQAMSERSRWDPHPRIDADLHLYLPDPVLPDPDETPLVERIFEAFVSAKQAQQGADPALLPAIGWQRVIDNSYRSLTRALETGDLSGTHEFLSNFLSWKEPTGIEDSRLIHEYSNVEHQRRYFERRAMHPLLYWWHRTESRGRDFSTLALPPIGNPCGVMVDGNIISRGSVFAEIHARTLAGLVTGDRPVVAELGGGFGRLAYFMSRNLDRFCYIGFDLPETLVCSAYYLIQAFPEKKFLLYGEDELTPDSVADYDFILWPSTELGRLRDRSVDLFINENSLGCMTSRSSNHYVRDICRISNQFWHRNHEFRTNDYGAGERSLANREYPVPLDDFDLVSRYLDIGPLIGEGHVDFDSDMMCYHYRRKPRTEAKRAEHEGGKAAALPAAR